MQNRLRRFSFLALVLAAGAGFETRLNAQIPASAPASQPGSSTLKTPPPTTPRTVAPSIPRPAPAPATPLTIVPEPGVDIVAPGSARWNAGEVDPATTPHLERVFTLQNTTPHPIVIGQLRGSCGCETLLLTKDNTPLRQTSLLPGEKVQVRVSIRMAGQHGGEMHKMAWVYAPGNTTPLATLDIALSVRTSIIAAPSLLNFGALNGGLNDSLPLTVSMDAALTPAGVLPPLVSSNADVSVVPEGKPQQIHAQRQGVDGTALPGRPSLALASRAAHGRAAIHNAGKRQCGRKPGAFGDKRIRAGKRGNSRRIAGAGHRV